MGTKGLKAMGIIGFAGLSSTLKPIAIYLLYLVVRVSYSEYLLGPADLFDGLVGVDGVTEILINRFVHEAAGQLFEVRPCFSTHVTHDAVFAVTVLLAVFVNEHLKARDVLGWNFRPLRAEIVHDFWKRVRGCGKRKPSDGSFAIPWRTDPLLEQEADARLRQAKASFRCDQQVRKRFSVFAAPVEEGAFAPRFVRLQQILKLRHLPSVGLGRSHDHLFVWLSI